jgi:hypothetical protein
VAIWPDEARLSAWDLPPTDPAVLLYQMIEPAPPAEPATANLDDVLGPGGPW